MLIITGISNEKTNELTIYGILCQNITMFYQQELAFLFNVHGKLEAYRNSSKFFELLFCCKLQSCKSSISIVVFSVLHF